MKTPEEIKKGLECCSIDPYHCGMNCPYAMDCHQIGTVKTLEKDALAYIQQLEAQIPKWISVEDEQKPKHLDQVLCTYVFDGDTEKHVNVLTYFAYGDNGYVTGAHFTDEGMCDMRVTHWMPLPEPPKEGV